MGVALAAAVLVHAAHAPAPLIASEPAVSENAGTGHSADDPRALSVARRANPTRCQLSVSPSTPGNSCVRPIPLARPGDDVARLIPPARPGDDLARLVRRDSP
jgi:hypothetical protein